MPCAARRCLRPHSFSSRSSWRAGCWVSSHYIRRHVIPAALVGFPLAASFARHYPAVAINIPLEELERRCAELGPLERPIVVFAHRLERGVKAAHTLRRLGYQDVFDAAGVRTKERLNQALVTAAEAHANQRATAELAGGRA